MLVFQYIKSVIHNPVHNPVCW